MRIIKPKFLVNRLKTREAILSSIERAGRTCYKSEDSVTPQSASKFVRMIIRRGHESVLEHESFTVTFICDRGVSHEIVRHRIASFSQESTRYCNYAKGRHGSELTFILPNWFQTVKEGHYSVPFSVAPNSKDNSYPEQVWLDSMAKAEVNYKTLIENGYTPQQARSVLPNSLKTEIVVTANLREWRTIFKQRTAIDAHPQMRELMCPLLDLMKKHIPEVFEDITY